MQVRRLKTKSLSNISSSKIMRFLSNKLFQDGVSAKSVKVGTNGGYAPLEKCLVAVTSIDHSDSKGGEDGDLAAMSILFWLYTFITLCVLCKYSAADSASGLCAGGCGRLSQFYSSPVSGGWVMSSSWMEAAPETLWCLTKQDVLRGLNRAPSPHLKHKFTKLSNTHTYNTHFPPLNYICTSAHTCKHTSDSCLLSRLLNRPPARSAEVPRALKQTVWKMSKRKDDVQVSSGDGPVRAWPGHTALLFFLDWFKPRLVQELQQPICVLCDVKKGTGPAEVLDEIQRIYIWSRSPRVTCEADLKY